MKLWIGGIIDAVIADEFRHIRNALEEKINAKVSSIDYGSGMSTWDVILVVSSTPPNEYVRYKKANKETDVRLVVNFDSFLAAQTSERIKMIEHTLMNSIVLLAKKNIIGFDFMRLQEDVATTLN